SRLDSALGTGPAKTLQRAFGMTTVGELLTHYPRRYANRGELTPIIDLPIGETVTIVAEVMSASVREMKARRGAMLEVTIGDGAGRMSLTFFGKGPGALEWRKNEL